MAEIFWESLEMAGMAGNGLKLLKITGNGWTYPEMAELPGHGWK